MQRNTTNRRTALLISVLLSALPGFAAAAAGVNIAGTSASQTYSYPTGEATVDWTRITVMPWWSNDHWQLMAEIPYLMRDATSEGTTYGLMHVGDTWVPVTVSGNYSESDNGIGDSYASATYFWHPKPWLSPYFVGELKLPTGDTDAVLIDFNPSYATSARSNGTFSFGNGSTDLRAGPGVRVANELAWARTEASWIWSNDDDFPTEDRAAAFAGVGLTPLKWLELIAAYNFEGEVVDGGDELQQTTYAVVFHPTGSKLAISVATYENDYSSSFSDNWSIGISAGL